MINYIDPSSGKSNLVIKYSLNLIFKKIETVFFIFLCLVCLITSKINHNISYKVNNFFITISIPIIKIVTFPINTSIDIVVNFNDLILAKKQNIKLKKDLSDLQNYFLKSLAIHQENKELRNSLNFLELKTENFKIARLIGVSHHLFNQKILVDSGLNKNIKEGQIITGDHSIIGRIVEVFDEKSRVMLLTDLNSRIPIIASRTRNRGILAGNNGRLMEILYLPKNHKIMVGDRIFTSSDGDMMPPGLLAGIVTKVDKDSVYVSGVENINNLNIVSIIEY